MNMKKHALFTGLLAAGLSLSANAAIVIDNWQFDVAGVDGLSGSNTVVTDVNFLVFNNVFHTTIDLTGGDNSVALDTGDTFTIDANGTIQNFHNTGGTVISPVLFNSVATLGGLDGWELTFDFLIDGVFSSDPTGVEENTNFDHTSGTLNFYVDRLQTGATTQSQPAINTINSTDGVLVASFAVVNDVGVGEYGGVFSSVLGNGGDRALFTLTANPFDVLKDSGGNSLALGSTLAITNSDFQSNVEGSGPFGYDPTSYNCGGQLSDFCGTESGQLRLAAAVPEPASLSLLGLGLVGLAGATFRRRRIAS